MYRLPILIAVGTIFVAGVSMLSSKPANAGIVYICFDFGDCANCNATYGNSCQIAAITAAPPGGTTYRKFVNHGVVGSKLPTKK